MYNRLTIRTITATLVALVSFGLIPFVSAEVSFDRTVIDPLFRSEGVAIGDINKDGKTDIVVGDLWYQAPDWKPHEIRRPRKPNRGGYTEAFGVYSNDFNRDGWIDVLVIPFHGKHAKWYENPKNKEGHWKERVAFKGTGNETRLYVNLFADGGKVFLMGVEGKIAWVAVPDDPTMPWPVHAISEDGHRAAHKFAHGLGIGDINGDGRKDVMYNGGWWEQPKDAQKQTGRWKFHNGAIARDRVADMYTVDTDGDGRVDIFSTSAHGKGFYWSRQTGSADAPKFEVHTLNKLIYESHSLNYADVDGDGTMDLVTGRRFFAHGFSPQKAGDPSPLYWFQVKTSKGATPELIPHKIDDQSGVGCQFLTTDFDGDGKLDIVISNRKGVFLFTQKK